MKTTTCKKCGTHNLIWRMSAKGHWYLSDPRTIGTNTHGNFITIPFAHKCKEVTAPVEEPRSKEYCEFRLTQLLEKQNLHPEWMTLSDLNELDMCKFQLEQSKAN